mmetsp:Transcript_79437/g.140191  ORF Transcript_79437/g.140191 Transcript_79437/m.140191 type:complete len:81 (-) Transcript_79437:602-844(-)
MEGNAGFCVMRSARSASQRSPRDARQGGRGAKEEKFSGHGCSTLGALGLGRGATAPATNPGLGTAAECLEVPESRAWAVA